MTTTTQSAPDPGELRALAVRVAAEAGELAARGQEGITVSDTKSSPTDVVTEMDRATEELIRSRLLTARPGDAFLGEEEGGDGPGTGPVRWIVDPIDGTVNYLYGRPDWAVAIAAEADGQIVAAAVAQPGRGRMYEAVRGGGSYLDGERLSAPEAVPLERALVATGFGYVPERRRRQAQVLLEVLPEVRDIRRSGSAALDLCGLATGQCDAYYERGLNPWDWAAPGLVAAEAGLRVAGARGGPPTGELVVAARPELFDQLEPLLVGAGADRDD